MPYKKTPTAVQLWTLRKEVAEDLPGTLKKVGEIGYQGVELWFERWPPAAPLKQALADANLKVAAAHVELADLLADFARIADYHRELGNTTLVVPIIPDPLKLTADDWRRIADELSRVADDARRAGFRFAYHHHDFEFKAKVGDVEVHDFLFAAVNSRMKNGAGSERRDDLPSSSRDREVPVPIFHPPQAEERMQAEIDVFFPTEMGRDPAALIRKFAGRVPLVHFKDKSPPGSRFRSIELGRGVIDWDTVLTACEAAGVEWYIVEQNCEDKPALDCIRASFEFLRGKGVV